VTDLRNDLKQPRNVAGLVRDHNKIGASSRFPRSGIVAMQRSWLRLLAGPLNLDLRWASARLDRLGSPESYISALIRDDGDAAAGLPALVALAAEIARHAVDQPLNLLTERNAPAWMYGWPGQHYKLLAAAVAVLQPKTVIDIGTFRGASALALLENLPPEGRVVTFDVLPWAGIAQTLLREDDARSARLTPVTADLSQPAVFERHADLLRDADLLFIDGPKDGNFEYTMLSQLRACGLKEGTLLIFDDIRLWNMLGFWRELELPKLDLTGFGHFTGTGLAHWV
jgi:predicted O-methyltransferase YrrM